MVACFSVVLHPIGKIQPLVIGLNLPQQVESPCWLLAILFQHVVGGANEGGAWPRGHAPRRRCEADQPASTAWLAI